MFALQQVGHSHAELLYIGYIESLLNVSFYNSTFDHPGQVPIVTNE